MASAVFRCPGCGAALKRAPSVPAGAKIRCPKCTAVIAAGGAAAPEGPAEVEERVAPRPVRPARRDDEDDDRPARGGRKGRDGGPPPRGRTKQSGVPLWALLAGGLALFALCGGCTGAAAFFALHGGGGGVPFVNRVTLDNFGKLKPDMTEAEVVAFLGPPAERSSEPDDEMRMFTLPQGEFKRLTWAHGDNTIKAYFVNDQCIYRRADFEGFHLGTGM
jgi:hypothetical protein